MRTVLSVAATALLLGCASASHDPTEDATLICVENDTEHPLTVEVRDAGTQSIFGTIHVSQFGTGKRWVRLGDSGNPVMVSVDAVGVPGRWVPPAFSRIILAPGVSLSLNVGMDGVTPFAHSSVGAGCRKVPTEQDSAADSASVDTTSSDSLPPDSASFFRSG